MLCDDALECSCVSRIAVDDSRCGRESCRRDIMTELPVEHDQSLLECSRAVRGGASMVECTTTSSSSSSADCVLQCCLVQITGSK
jgi:hypothetical protein